MNFCYNGAMLTFEPLSEGHFTLIHNWFNKPHVQAFYSLRSWTQEEVNIKLTPYLYGEKQIQSFVISIKSHPIGYIQSYPIKDHPWENQDLRVEIIDEAAGLDLFIGEEDYLGKGLGCQIIDAFLENHIWQHYRYCLADPDIRNVNSISLFCKCGFKEYQQIDCKDALHRPVTLQLFLKEKK